MCSRSDAEIASVDQLLGVLERGAGKSAALIDMPPMEIKELRSSIAELAAERKELPGPDELQALYDGLSGRRAPRTARCSPSRAASGWRS